MQVEKMTKKTKYKMTFASAFASSMRGAINPESWVINHFACQWWSSEMSEWHRSHGDVTCTPGGGGDSHMKQTGMLVVSLKGVNFGFWSRLGCSRQSANNLCCQGLVYGSAKRQNYAGWVFFNNHVLISLKLISCCICMLFSGLF